MSLLRHEFLVSEARDGTSIRKAFETKGQAEAYARENIVELREMAYYGYLYASSAGCGSEACKYHIYTNSAATVQAQMISKTFGPKSMKKIAKNINRPFRSRPYNDTKNTRRAKMSPSSDEEDAPSSDEEDAPSSDEEEPAEEQPAYRGSWTPRIGKVTARQGVVTKKKRNATNPCQVEIEELNEKLSQMKIQTEIKSKSDRRLKNKLQTYEDEIASLKREKRKIKRDADLKISEITASAQSELQQLKSASIRSVKALDLNGNSLQQLQMAADGKLDDEGGLGRSKVRKVLQANEVEIDASNEREQLKFLLVKHGKYKDPNVENMKAQIQDLRTRLERLDYLIGVFKKLKKHSDKTKSHT